MQNRKKVFLLLIFAIVLISVIAYIGFVPKKMRHEVAVPYTMLKTGEQLNRVDNLVKWYLPFAGNDSLRKITGNRRSGIISDNTYSIQINNPTSISGLMESVYKDKKMMFQFAAISDSGDMQSSRVQLEYKTTLWNEWMDKGKLIKNAKQSLENLKNYMEDTRQFYGYEIERTTVADTSFIFMSSIVPLSEKKQETKKLFDQLLDYAKKNDVGYNGTRIFYSQSYGRDQVMLFASIGVSKMVVTSPDFPIKYKRMPFGKNLIAANYQGPYGQVSKAYEALENFKRDHNLSSMAIPYQKFLSEGYDFADDEVVQLKVYYPIF